MVVQKKALMESLKMAMPGIETGNSTLSGADAFIFHSGRIYSYNDLISVAVPIEQAGLVEESIEGAVHADEFFKVISKFPSDEIEFEVAEKKWVLKNEGYATANETGYTSQISLSKPLDCICILCEQPKLWSS